MKLQKIKPQETTVKKTGTEISYIVIILDMAVSQVAGG
jgi:hypothetical protein